MRTKVAAGPGKVRLLTCQQHLPIGRRDELALQVDHVGVVCDQAVGHRAARQDKAGPQSFLALVSRAEAGRVTFGRVQAARAQAMICPAALHICVELAW